jgi:hypothetical protein
MIAIKDNQLFIGDANGVGRIYPRMPRLLEPEEIRAGPTMCLGDKWLIEWLMRHPEAAFYIFMRYALTRLWDGCTHGGMQHRALEDLLARSKDLTMMCEPEGSR